MMTFVSPEYAVNGGLGVKYKESVAALFNDLADPENTSVCPFGKLYGRFLRP